MLPPRNATNTPVSPAVPPTGLPVALRRTLGALLLGATMWIAGVLALARAAVETFRW